MNARPTTLTVEIEQRGDIMVIRPSGAMDYWSVGPLREELNRHLVADPPKIVLDLFEVAYCDSSGLGLLLEAQRRAHAAGGWLRVARPHLQMRRVLALTRLDRYIVSYASVHAAIETAEAGQED